jgi:hypothetical protein
MSNLARSLQLPSLVAEAVQRQRLQSNRDGLRHRTFALIFKSLPSRAKLVSGELLRCSRQVDRRQGLAFVQGGKEPGE